MATATRGSSSQSGSANTIGGADAGASNVISANGFATPDVDQDGVAILGKNTRNNLVEGNLIGTDATGAIALGNAGAGVHLEYETGQSYSDLIHGMGNTIGGSIAGARNVISGNGDDGISIEGYSTYNEILGNYIGTDITGTKAIPNSPGGVRIDHGSSDNTIGGPAGAGNLISGNVGDASPGGEGDGVEVDDPASGGDGNLYSTGILVSGNEIGLAINGDPLGNQGNGVIFSGESSGTVGGSTADAGNTIAFNRLAGVAELGSSGQVILSNLIVSDDKLGIDMGDDELHAEPRVHRPLAGQLSGADGGLHDRRPDHHPGDVP